MIQNQVAFIIELDINFDMTKQEYFQTFLFAKNSNILNLPDREIDLFLMVWICLFWSTLYIILAI